MRRFVLLLLPVLAVAAVLAARPHAQSTVPTYALQFLGPGAPRALNNTGTIVGARLVNVQDYQALVSRDGGAWSTLPSPAGAASVFPTGVNDAGVIVGVAYTAGNAEAVRWRPATSGYAVEKLPKLPGDGSSYATAINNLGEIVGARRALGYVPAAASGWLYSDSGGLVDLYATYGLFDWPRDINDAGQILGGIERLDLATGARANISAGPAPYDPVVGVAINNAGRVAGAAALRSTSLVVVSAFRFEPGAGWTMLGGSSRYTTASSINGRGDVGWGELGPALFFDGLGSYALGNLLDGATKAAGWAVTGSGVLVNDGREVATVGRNGVTGEAGAVRLVPSGILMPPAAPVLTGTPHPFTSNAPWSGISLSWTVSDGATAYVVERRSAGASAFVELTPTGGTIQTIYDDLAVTAGATYIYRVLAIGAGGRSAPSNEVTVTAPATDTTAPVVTILSPAPGARVSGVVTVRATASDAVGVTHMELRLGSSAVLATVSGASLTYAWNTSGLKKGSSQTLTVRAWDAAGNVGLRSVTVRIGR